MLLSAFLSSGIASAQSSDIVPEVKGDTLSLPHFTQMQGRYSLGSTVVIKGEELEKYSSTDIRNMLTAIVPGVEVVEKYGGPGVSPLEHIGQYGAATKVSVTSRGRQMMYMVDDIPVNINETPLDPQQIESVTIVRDVLEKALYGATAANGIVYIRTKRGKSNSHYLSVDVEGGVNVVDRFPEYVSGTEYAALNNLARKNSGIGQLYTKTDIEEYAKNDPYDVWHPNVNFRKMMLKNVMYYSKANVSAGGGTDNVKYYAFLGYAGEDDIYKIGPAADYNRININANLDIKLHRYITARIGLLSTMGIRRSSNYGYSPNWSSQDASSNTTLSAIEMPGVLNDINGIPAISFPIYANNDPSLESPWYAVSSLYRQNPIANILENGAYTETIRKGLVDVALDIDLSWITKGLRSVSYGAYDATNLVRLGTAEDYAAYMLVKGIDEHGNDAMIPQQSTSHSVKEMSNKTRLLDYFSNRFYFVQKFGYDRTFGRHDVSAAATYMITKRSQKLISEHRREINFGVNAGYVYDGRYILQAAANVHGTYALIKNRWSVSPTVGLGWIMSEEDFLKDVEGLDLLKLRVQGGILSYDSYFSANRDVDNYSWNESGTSFGPYPNNQWFGSGTSYVDRTYPNMLGNPNLRLEQRKELTAGVDGAALGSRLNFSVSYFNILEDGPVSQLTNVLPLVAGVSQAALWMNYEKTRYQGYDLSVGWHDRTGDFSYAISGWASGLYSKVIRADEPDYRDAYRSKVGYSSTAAWGLRCIGQFATDEETRKVPQLFDGELHAGDLKYEDMNGDGVIDDNDICVIGDYTPKLTYGISVNLKYRGFDLTLTGSGRAFYDIALTNSYFWNGWGDGNYSAYIRDNAGNPNHPALTYNKVNNNFKTSTFWMEDGSYFKLQTVELGYEFPMKKWTSDVMKRMRLFLRGNNLFTISKIRYVDPEAVNAGVSNYPLNRTFVMGLKFTF